VTLNLSLIIDCIVRKPYVVSGRPGQQKKELEKEAARQALDDLKREERQKALSELQAQAAGGAPYQA
jgi:hypothetical protein